VDGGIDARQHPVQRRAEPAHLGPGVVRADPAGEVAGADRIGLGGHGLDRPQPAPHDPGDAARGEQPSGRQADGEDEFELPDGPIDVTEAGGGVDGAVTGEGLGQQPELNVPVSAGHGLGLLVPGEGGQAGWQLGHQTGISVDEHQPRPTGGHLRDVELAKDARRQDERPGNHPLRHGLAGRFLQRLGDERWGGRARGNPRETHPVQAENGLQPRVGLVEKVATQRGDGGDVEGHQRDQGDRQHPGQHPGAELGPPGAFRHHRRVPGSAMVSLPCLTHIRPRQHQYRVLSACEFDVSPRPAGPSAPLPTQARWTL
jgi:hypothetical protein